LQPPIELIIDKHPMEPYLTVVKWAEAPGFLIVLLQLAEVAYTTAFARTLLIVLEQSYQAVPQTL
jgi:hypothetical protein